MPIGLITIVCLLGAGFAVGGRRERRHLERLKQGEAKAAHLPATTGLALPGNPLTRDPSLVSGSVVISVDYFKRFLASLRIIIGGRLPGYETLLARARRDAVLRMKQAAIGQGADGIINVRIETARLATGRGDNGVAGVEVLAYGTAIRT